VCSQIVVDDEPRVAEAPENILVGRGYVVHSYRAREPVAAGGLT
jgi:hypothetical protein